MAPGPGYFFTRDGLALVQIPVHVDDPAEDEVLARGEWSIEESGSKSKVRR